MTYVIIALGFFIGGLIYESICYHKGNPLPSGSGFLIGLFSSVWPIVLVSLGVYFIGLGAHKLIGVVVRGVENDYSR